MKKFLIITLVLYFITMPVFAKIITGEIRYGTESARDEILQNEFSPFDYQDVRNNFIDKNKTQNLTCLLQGKTNLNDRILGYFSDGSYGVVYKNNPKTVYYYNSSGVLIHNEIRDSLDYPYKSIKYNHSGLIVNKTLRVSEDETFIFDSKGKLIAHWYGQNCYDENNNVIMTRKILK